jgi:hypothetical protein
MRLALYVFWLLPVPVLIGIATVMYRRKQHFSYPIFWSYICFQCFRLVTEFICNLISYKVYFYAFWSCSLANFVLTLLLLRSIFRSVLEEYSSLDTMRRIGYEITAATLWFTAFALTIGLMHSHGWPRRIARAELMASFTGLGMFLLVVATSRILGIKWRSGLCGIAAGLGVMGTADLFVYTAMSWARHLSRPAAIASWVETLAFDAAISIFAVYFLPAPFESQTPGELRPDLLAWAESMRGAIRR